MRRLIALIALAAATLAAARAGRSEDPPSLERGHAEIAAPFIQKHCLGCHDDKKREGDLILDGLVEKGAHERARSLWRRVEERVSAGEMPPEDKPRPAKDESDAFLAWVRARLAATDPAGSPTDPGRVTARRLNRAEYSYTVQDLLRVRARPRDEFPADDVGYGFDRIGDVLTISPLLLERYLAAAEAISTEAILDWKPIKVRRDASELDARGNGSPRDAFWVLYSNGRIDAKVKVPWSGEYVVRVRAYGDQAGPDPARMALLVDRDEVERFDVKAVQSKPEVFEKRVQLEAGERLIAASFVNDYYKPNDPDPKNRDRNLAVGFIEVEGPREPPPLPWAQQTWFSKRPAPKAKPVERRQLAREVLAPFASRAWRRPAKPEELEKLVKLVELAVTEGETWERGLQLALQAVLVSPSFLFRLELEAAPDKKTDGATMTETLDQHALASRLSYFIWSSLPDDELVREAEAGTLRDHLDAQVKRLLDDPKSQRLVEQFAPQWLHLRRLEGFQPDPQTFPDFDEDLRASARAETEKLFETVLREGLPIRALVDADFTFVNDRLARHYGIEAPGGSELKRVEAPLGRRGLLGHASILMATSNPTRTSPVKRGRWILEVLLDDPPPPPLPGADSLKDEKEQVHGKSLRERLELHRAKAECATCHARMDPLGFALERFDAIGARREKDGELELDDTGALQDGTKLEGAAGLRKWLAQRSPRIARGVARKLLVFALGRGPVAGDDVALDRLLDALGPDPKLKDVIVELVKLDAFQKRRVEGGRTFR